MKVNDLDTMLRLQGDQVLLVVGDEEFIFTIIHFADIGHRELQLANRADRNSEPLTLTQAALDNLVPLKHERAKWKLVL